MFLLEGVFHDPFLHITEPGSVTSSPCPLQSVAIGASWLFQVLSGPSSKPEELRRDL